MEVCLASSVRVRRAGLTRARRGVMVSPGGISKPIPEFGRLVGAEWVWKHCLMAMPKVRDKGLMGTQQHLSPGVESPTTAES